MSLLGWVWTGSGRDGMEGLVGKAQLQRDGTGRDGAERRWYQRSDETDAKDDTMRAVAGWTGG